MRWFNPGATERKPTSTASTHTSTTETLNLRQFLLDYRKQKELAEGVGAEEEEEKEEEESADAGKSNSSASLVCFPVIFILFILLFIAFAYSFTGCVKTILSIGSSAKSNIAGYLLKC